ncbi:MULTISPECIES: MOSC domain-containing protein [unclassified Leptolyngbya]|uniref:MOSC domain-containing protein n=1 Tax=unclassified Leptolyngbya TaxID=2650499 RepID=UPI0016861602|nr:MULTISPECIES: MOSC domain-containing protein [unclassified Leptolyngbya]MBD1913054.1 MGMT family protein [Leptolyngbya sp. FACHB-8]MBD2154445.1 MGMT family protein [Leptolyngbya sp. FACHB-16]
MSESSTSVPAFDAPPPFQERATWISCPAVTHLFRKSAPGALVEPCDSLTLQRGYGIAGDASARVGNPRQVLLAGQPTLHQFGLQPGDLQENILVDAAVESFESGTVLAIGKTAQLRLMFLCEPCASLERLKPGLSRKIAGKRGFLAMVVQDGTIRPGDIIRAYPRCFSVIPESTRGKFEEFVARIPPGYVVDTPNLLLALGMTPSYARAIPTWLKKSAHLPVHRIVAANHTLLTRHIPDQADALVAEGVTVEGDRISPQFLWPPEFFHVVETK